MTKASGWRDRIRALGITQAQLARRLGIWDETLSRSLNGEPMAYVIAAIEAAEIMTPEQRQKWLA